MGIIDINLFKNFVKQTIAKQEIMWIKCKGIQQCGRYLWKLLAIQFRNNIANNCFYTRKLTCVIFKLFHEEHMFQNNITK